MFWIALFVTGGLMWNGLSAIANTAIGSTVFTFLGSCFILDFTGLVILENNQFLMEHLRFMIEAQLPMLALLLACLLTAIIHNVVANQGKDITSGEAAFVSIVFPPVAFIVTMINSWIFYEILALSIIPSQDNHQANLFQVLTRQLGIGTQPIALGGMEVSKAYSHAYWGLVFGGTAWAMVLLAIVIGVSMTIAFRRLHTSV